MSIYIIPPLLSVYFFVCLSLIIYSGKPDPVKLYFAPVTFFWILAPLYYLSCKLISNIPAVHQVDYTLISYVFKIIYAQGPFVHLWSIAMITNKKNTKIFFSVFCTGMILSILNINFINGLIYINLFTVFSGFTAFYCLKLLYGYIKTEENSILKQKSFYLLISLVLELILLAGNYSVILGYQNYSPSNFSILPIIVFAYGVLNYRILEFSDLFNRVFSWTVGIIITIIPNFLIFDEFSSFFRSLDIYITFAAIVFWFYVNTKLLNFIFFTLNILLNKQKYNFRKVESDFIEDILFLKDIGSLSEEFKKIFTNILDFKDADLFIWSVGESKYKNLEGKKINIDSVIVQWFIKNNHLVDYDMVDTNPAYLESKDVLLGFLDENHCNYIVPVIGQGQMVGVVLLTKKIKSGELSAEEVKFVNNIRGFVAIAILNSLLFQNVSTLKDELEVKTELLEAEIKEKNDTQEVLKESEKKYRILADNVIDVIWVLDLESSTFIYLSPSLKKQLGYLPSELVGRGAGSILTGESYKNMIVAVERIIDKKAENYKTLIVELEAIHKNGNKLWIEISAHFIIDDMSGKIEIIGVSRDITERKKAESDRDYLENKLRQSQKMESIGALAGGIAHDFNNILMAILGYTQLIDLYIEQKKFKRASDRVVEVEKACQRAQEMVSKILTFSRQTEQVKKEIRIKSVVDEALSLLKISLPSTIEIVKDFFIEDGIVNADAVQIHQIVLNLGTNAYHAMEEEGGGELRISLEFKEIDEKKSKELCVKKGLFIALTIEDTGGGMDLKTKEKIFDPYFTTKEVGKGTGMGLSVVHGIVLNHEGAITVDSRPGMGTKFTVYLPGIKESGKLHEEKYSKVKASNPEKFKILFVDDEEVLCELAEEVLSNSGHFVETVTSSKKALQIFKDNPDKFDIVITDLTMPEMTGDILISKIKEIRQNIRIILCTGYNYRLSEKMRKKINVDMYLVKPLSITDIDEAVKDVTDQ